MMFFLERQGGKSNLSGPVLRSVFSRPEGGYNNQPKYSTRELGEALGLSARSVAQHIRAEGKKGPERFDLPGDPDAKRYLLAEVKNLLEKRGVL